MLLKKADLVYPFLLLLSIGKRSFENLGKIIQISGRKVASMLPSDNTSFTIAHRLCQSVFSTNKRLFLIIDDTLIKKIYANNMRGSSRFFDTKIGRMVNAFRLVTSLISDGKLSIPINCSYLFAKEIIKLCSESFLTKDDIAKSFVRQAKTLFPNIEIIVLADGLYATKAFLRWCFENKILIECRMHSNRVVMYKGYKIHVRELAMLQGVRLQGKQTARTVSVEWHDIKLELTISKRIDKHGNESLIYQAATYKAEPREHIKNYKIRWNTECLNRTEKQHIGVGDCFSKDFAIQQNHIAAALLAYALTQLEKKKSRLKNAEQGIRALKERFVRQHLSELIDEYESFLHFDA